MKKNKYYTISETPFEYPKIDTSQFYLFDEGNWFIQYINGKYILDVVGGGHFGTGGVDDLEITKEDVEFLRENRDKIKVIMRKYGYY